MSDTELYAAMRDDRQRKHRDAAVANRAAIAAAGLAFIDKGEALLFRIAGRPPVDFYPSTGRWRVAGAQAFTYRGGAAVFLRWFAKQERSA